ncbi:MAG: hypothetical protein WDN48_00705 [Pseudolabrys sp.]
MRRSTFDIRQCFALVRRAMLVMAAAGLLSACETDGKDTPGPFAALTAPSSKPAEPAKPEPPMTHPRAAMECWMKTEKGNPNENLEKRADVVNKCIDDKMKSASAAPKS